MGELLMYLLLAVFGYILAYKVIKQSLDSQITGGIQTVAILILVFSMGARMGANDEVVRNLNKIGLFALFLTVTVLLFSVISVSVFRRVIGLDREGRTKKKEQFLERKKKMKAPRHPIYTSRGIPEKLMILIKKQMEV